MAEFQFLLHEIMAHYFFNGWFQLQNTVNNASGSILSCFDLRNTTEPAADLKGFSNDTDSPLSTEALA